MMHVIIYITLLMARISTRGMRRFSFEGLRVRSKHRKLQQSYTKANYSIFILRIGKHNSLHGHSLIEAKYSCNM